MAKSTVSKQDPLSSLPIELASQILCMALPTDLIRLRCVSKSWQELLTAEDVCRAAICTLYPTAGEHDLDPENDGPLPPYWQALLEARVFRAKRASEAAKRNWYDLTPSHLHATVGRLLM